MRKQLIAAAASTALLAMAGAAQAQTVGHVGLNYGRVNLDLGGVGDTNVDAPQLEGAVKFDTGSIGVSVDGSVTRFSDAGDDATVWSATGHVNGQVGEGLAGVFGGLTDSSGVTLWAVGVEGQTALGPQASLYGQLGYGQADDLNDVDFWAGRVELRYFLTENFKVQGFGGYTKADANGGDLDVWNIGADAEYQFAGTPWSITGGYEHAKLKDFALNSDTFRIGVRYTFGGTVQDRDRAGASLGSVNNLFGGAIGQSVIAVLGQLAP